MTWRQRLAIGILIGAHLALSGVSIFVGLIVFIPLAVGVLLGQQVLLALWLVCLQDSRSARWLDFGLAQFSLWLAHVLALSGLPFDMAFILAVLFAMAAVTHGGWLAVTWRWTRWRISLPQASGRQQFSLRRLLLTTAIACVLLAFARLVVVPELPDSWSVDEWIVVAVGCGILSVNSLFLAPLLIAFFTHDEPLRFDGMLIVIGGLGTFYLVLISILDALLLPLVQSGGDQLLGLLCFNFAQILTVAVSLASLRRIGFRLDHAPRGASEPT